MTHRGVQAARRRTWEIDQRRMGREDALAGRRASLADQHYQRGYREGKLPCQCPTVAAHDEGCQRKPTDGSRLCDFCRVGHHEPED